MTDNDPAQLTVGAIKALKNLLDEVRADVRNMHQRPWRPEDDHQAPEVYVGLTSSTIPALKPHVGSANEAEPGTGSVAVYQLVFEGDWDLIGIGASETAFNLSSSPVAAGTWVLLTRDKFGSWIIITLLGSGLTTCKGYLNSCSGVVDYLRFVAGILVSITTEPCDDCKQWYCMLPPASAKNKCYNFSAADVVIYEASGWVNLGGPFVTAAQCAAGCGHTGTGTSTFQTCKSMQTCYEVNLSAATFNASLTGQCQGNGTKPFPDTVDMTSGPGICCWQGYGGCSPLNATQVDFCLSGNEAFLVGHSPYDVGPSGAFEYVANTASWDTVSPLTMTLVSSNTFPYVMPATVIVKLCGEKPTGTGTSTHGGGGGSSSIAITHAAGATSGGALVDHLDVLLVHLVPGLLSVWVFQTNTTGSTPNDIQVQVTGGSMGAFGPIAETFIKTNNFGYLGINTISVSEHNCVITATGNYSLQANFGSGGETAVLEVYVFNITGLVSNVGDKANSAAGNVTAPDSGTTAVIGTANEASIACFASVAPGINPPAAGGTPTYTLGGYTSDTVTGLTVQFVEMRLITSAVSTLDAQITNQTPPMWVGGVVSYK